MDTVGEGERYEWRQQHRHVHTAACDSSQPVRPLCSTGSPARRSVMTCGGEGLSLKEEGTDAYLGLSPSVAQQKLTLESSCIPIKN